MNGTYYPNPTFPIENILRLNKGKKAKVFCSFPDSNEWRDRIYDGIIEQSGKDHLVMSSPERGDWYLIPMIYVNWVEFEEPINFKVF